MFLSEIGLSIPIYERGAGGIPSSNFVEDLAARCEGYEQTIAARGGFESMRTGFKCSLNEALSIFDTWLGRSTIVSVDTTTIWEGQLAEIGLTLGQRRRSISLDKLANRLRCRYTDTNGTTAVTSSTSDATSIALYGTKDAVISASNITSTQASGAAARALAQWKNPQQQPDTKIMTGNLGDVAIDLLFRGWYWTLGWVVTSSTSTTNTATATQIGNLIATSGSGIGATNAFLSTATTNIGTTGRTPSEFIPPETPYSEKFDQFIAEGDGTDRWVLMCLENRELYFRKWAGASPSTISYVASLGDHQIYTPEGRAVAPWFVRPDTMYQEIDLLNASTVASYDDATRQYVERVVCTISPSRVGVTLEPQASDSLDTLLRSIS